MLLVIDEWFIITRWHIKSININPTFQPIIQVDVLGKWCSRAGIFSACLVHVCLFILRMGYDTQFFYV